MHASQTGHLVLATLHSNGAIDTINRLKHLGIPLHEMASQISLITAQRLLRKKKNNDYEGRFAIHEVLSIDDEIAAAITHQRALKPTLNERGFYTLKHAAETALKNKLTTQNEIDRVLGK